MSSGKDMGTEWIEDIVVRYTKVVLMQDDVIEDIENIVLRVASTENTSVILLKQQLSEIERAIANLMNAIEQGINTESAATSALTVVYPSEGEQSMKM